MEGFGMASIHKEFDRNWVIRQIEATSAKVQT
jgi:hypothetical protein